MATYQAISAVSQAIVHLMRSQFSPAEFGDNNLEFDVYAAEDFQNAMEMGVSVFLYRVSVNGVYRTPSGRLTPDGRRQRTMLPLDLHFLLTVWANEPSLQHQIVGWMMRVLEDTPSLVNGQLNHQSAGIFQPDETVELTVGEMSNDEFFHLWEILGSKNYHVSVPYLARVVRIESGLAYSQGAPVQERLFDARKLVNQ
jgi:hypothetical protein